MTRAEATLLVERHRFVGVGMREDVVPRNLGNEAAACGLTLRAGLAHLPGGGAPTRHPGESAVVTPVVDGVETPTSFPPERPVEQAGPVVRNTAWLETGPEVSIGDEALETVGDPDSARCRESVVERFRPEVRTAGHEAAHRRAIAAHGGTPGDVPPEPNGTPTDTVDTDMRPVA